MTTEPDFPRKLVIFGVGNMGTAILAGLLRTGMAAAQITVCDADQTRTNKTAAQFGVAAVADPLSAVQDADVVIIAVKPKDVSALCRRLSAELHAEALVVSVAAGLTTQDLAASLPPGQRTVRVMPNTPAAVGAGVSAISGGETATDDDLALVEKLFKGCGTVVVVPESQQAAVGALSGSGPAYVFYLIDALAEAGVLNGLPRDLALKLAVDTVAGSAQLLAETGEHPVLARERVTSPGGTTAAALQQLDAGGVRAAVLAAVDSAVAKTAALRLSS